MTLQLRPTFSESWYRVKTLRAKLRPTAQISRQHYRGERWYVVRDPAGNQFHRLSDPAYRFVALLDGRRTVEQAWDLAGGQLADDAPTQPEVIQILSHLYSANLIDADVTPDATVLLRRHKKLTQRKMKGRMMNVLFPRIPLWDPDRFLKLWMPVVRLGFSKLGALVWLAVIIFTITRLAPMSQELKEAARHSISPGNWMYLWGVFVAIKLIHELGHAFACRRFGGECHELGIMFLVFIPTPYVDASSAWSFPSKWQRMFVGAAGMIVELFVAAICALIWMNIDRAGLTGQLLFNTMLVAGVSTVVFNANPLLRYDGYYILSDWLEIPNLRQKSSEYAMGLIKRHLFRVKQQQPLPPAVQRVWLLFYAIASTIYRTIVGFAIMMLVFFSIPVLGVLMALGGLITWALVPIFKTVKYLALEPELHRKRTPAILITLGAVAAVVVLVGLVRFPVNIDQVGIIEPVRRETLRGLTSGFVVELGKHADGRPLRDGDLVKKGQVLWVAQDRKLDAKIAALRAGVLAAQAELTQSIATDAAKRQIDENALLTARKELQESLDRQAELTVRAPFDGQLIAPFLHEMPTRFLQKGQEGAMVADLSRLEVITLVEQRESQQVLRDPNATTQIRPAGRIGTVLKGERIEDRGPAKATVSHAALTMVGGDNEVALDPSDPSGKRLAVPQFEIRVKLAAEDANFVPGQKAYVRFKLGSQPLMQQWARRFWQLLQEEKAQSTW